MSVEQIHGFYFGCMCRIDAPRSLTFFVFLMFASALFFSAFGAVRSSLTIGFLVLLRIPLLSTFIIAGFRFIYQQVSVLFGSLVLRPLWVYYETIRPKKSTCSVLERG